MLEHNGLSVHCPVMYVLPSTNSRGWHGMALIEMDVVLTLWDKVTRGISDHGVFPVTQMKAVLCYESLSFRAQLQCCAGSDNT